MKIRASGGIAALILGTAALAGPAAAQFKGVGGHAGGVGAPHVGGAGIAAHPGFGSGLGASPSFGAREVGGAAPLTAFDEWSS
jgi:hypothetical protein